MSALQEGKVGRQYMLIITNPLNGATPSRRDRLGVAVGIWGYNLEGTSPLQLMPKERWKGNSKMK